MSFWKRLFGDQGTISDAARGKSPGSGRELDRCDRTEVESKDGRGAPPLQRAAPAGREEAAKTLAASGAGIDTNISDSKHDVQTPAARDEPEPLALAGSLWYYQEADIPSRNRYYIFEPDGTLSDPEEKAKSPQLPLKAHWSRDGEAIYIEFLNVYAGTGPPATRLWGRISGCRMEGTGDDLHGNRWKWFAERKDASERLQLEAGAQAEARLQRAPSAERCGPPPSFSATSDVENLVREALDGGVDASAGALARLREHPQRQEAVPVVMGRYRADLLPAAANRSRKLGFDASCSLYRVCKVLKAVGTESAVLALIEILRSVKPTPISSYGYPSRDKGDDGTVAYAVSSIPNGLTIAKSVCNADEFEPILVLASDCAGGPDSADLIRALEEYGTPHAIVWLVECLRARGLAADKLELAKAALVRLGAKAHPKLLLEIGRTACARPEDQIRFWTGILDVLKESGDAACIPPIQELIKNSPPMASLAQEAIEKIRGRARPATNTEATGTKSTPPSAPPNPQPPSIQPMPANPPAAKRPEAQLSEEAPKRGGVAKAKESSFLEIKFRNAAYDGDLELAKALLKDHPGLVFSRDDDGETPLHYAAKKAHKEVVELLLANNAEVNAKSNSGKTPLRCAADKGHENVVKFLRQHGGQE